MTLTSQIKKYIPALDSSVLACTALDAIGDHFVAEISYIKTQRPTPSPATITPMTANGDHFDICVTISQNIINASTAPDIVNPYSVDTFSPFHVLNALIEAYEANLTGLLAYYNTPNPSVPPAGYPTIPIPRPITIPLPVVPPLVSVTLLQFFGTYLNANLKTPATYTAQFELFMNGVVDFLLLEVFV